MQVFCLWRLVAKLSVAPGGDYLGRDKPLSHGQLRQVQSRQRCLPEYPVLGSAFRFRRTLFPNDGRHGCDEDDLRAFLLLLVFQCDPCTGLDGLVR